MFELLFALSFVVGPIACGLILEEACPRIHNRDTSELVRAGAIAIGWTPTVAVGHGFMILPAWVSLVAGVVGGFRGPPDGVAFFFLALGVVPISMVFVMALSVIRLKARLRSRRENSN